MSFIEDVAPILKENCMGCHGAKNPKGKLDMTRYESFRRGIEDDPIVPGKPDESYIINVLTATDSKRMPPKDAADALPGQDQCHCPVDQGGCQARRGPDTEIGHCQGAARPLGSGYAGVCASRTRPSSASLRQKESWWSSTCSPSWGSRGTAIGSRPRAQPAAMVAGPP